MNEIDKLYNPSQWGDPVTIHRIFASLRKKETLIKHSCQGYLDIWQVTKHADICEVEKNADTFINEPRQVIMPTVQEEAIRAMNNGSLHMMRALPNMDRPEHSQLRRLVVPFFMPSKMTKLDDSVNDSIDKAMAVLREKGGCCDFAKDVAAEYPLRVVLKFLGVPSEDFSLILRMTQQFFGSQDPDMQRTEAHSDRSVALAELMAEFNDYFRGLAEKRRQNPTDDIASALAHAKVDGEPLGERELLGFYEVIATAGHDTTSYSLLEAIHQLAQSPELFERLRSDPDDMAGKITEEAIRYASVVSHFLRTATRDYELRGQKIKKGDTLALWYPSGSRDEEVFEEPDRFNPDRDMSTRHTTFGHGAHVCLGMHLARREISMFLKRLAVEVSALELNGEPRYAEVLGISGLKYLPVNATLT